jgi:hypothetical protein
MALSNNEIFFEWQCRLGRANGGPMAIHSFAEDDHFRTAWSGPHRFVQGDYLKGSFSDSRYYDKLTDLVLMGE